MEIRIAFGRKNQHSLRTRNQNLETQVRVLTEALEKSNEDNEGLRDQLKEALADRIAKGHRLKAVDMMQGRLQLVPTETENRFKIEPVQKVEAIVSEEG